MSDAITVVYVDRELVDAAVEPVRTDDTFRVLRAETGTDALKRLHSERVGALVLPDAMPDVELGDLVTKAREAEPSVAVFVVGDGGEGGSGAGDGSVDGLPADVIRVSASPADAGRSLVDRLRAAVGDRRVDEALHRHERLEDAGLRLARAAVAAADRSDLERAVHDELVESGAYRFVWVGRYRPDSEEFDVSHPLPGRFSLASVAASVGADDGNFLAEAVERGTVAVQRGDGSIRSAAAAGAGEGVSADGMAFAAVPFVDDDRAHGVAILGTAEPGAFDSTERSLLERLGSIVGHALAADEPSRPERVSDPERIQRFVDVLAHELRNPLQIATSYLTIGREHGEGDAFDRVAEAHETIGEIIDSTVALVQEGGVDEIVPIDVGAAAMEVWGDLDVDAGDLTIVDSPNVRADPDALNRVLSNLFRNAVDHGGTDVSVSVGSLSDDAGFYVEDDGPGVPEEDRESVFEWGFSTSDSGLGIGLGFVREIVEAHGWRISVVAGRDGGARFEIHTDAEAEPDADGEGGLSDLFDDWDPPEGAGSGVDTEADTETDRDSFEFQRRT